MGYILICPDADTHIVCLVNWPVCHASAIMWNGCKAYSNKRSAVVLICTWLQLNIYQIKLFWVPFKNKTLYFLFFFFFSFFFLFWIGFFLALQEVVCLASLFSFGIFIQSLKTSSVWQTAGHMFWWLKSACHWKAEQWDRLGLHV